ncbi:DUF2963 domain-containing protein [Mulberry dwarf phytoplasma]|uniref:DUF2963 domain-containing protein n=1 Tax=Mulberry dwarf phytoplasma TaxID=186171 RepID=UPI002A4E1E47|nr:DUF2963 domain-containing protein [Mulberry dwarf phytoplasma]
MLKNLKIRKLIMMVVCGLLSFIPLTFAAQISYHPNGTIDSISEYDPQTGNKIKYTSYNFDGTIKSIGEYDPQTGYIIKWTLYNSDGTIDSITEYDPQTGNEIKWTLYKSDGTIKSIGEYDPQTGNEIKWTLYKSDGTIKSIGEYDPQTGNKIKETDYNEDGKTTNYINEYDPKTGKLIKQNKQSPSKTLGRSFFHRQTKSTIKLADYKTLQEEWLTFQPKMKRYDISVLSKESIPEILKYAGIKSDVVAYDNFKTPSYNSNNDSIFYWHIKDPPEGLMGVYFKPRSSNPFNIKYPAANKKYTLEDLLKYEIAIEEVFVFWDAQQKTQEEKVNLKVIISNIFVDQSKEEVINAKLTQMVDSQKPKLIKLGCYNATPNTGLVVPLPSDDWNGLKIEAIYFDDGIRLLPQETSTIDDLLKLSNGAKNIYLFSFNTQKRIKSIELHDAIDPYQAIRTWKRDNNLFDYEGEFIRQTDSKQVGCW